MHQHETVDQLLEKAKNLITVNRCREAEKHLYQAIAQEPAHPEAWYWLGRCKLAMKKPQEALEVVQQFRQHHPQNEYAFLLASEALLMLQRSQEAKEQIEAALAINPDQAVYYAILSRCLLLLHDEPAAVQAAIHGLQLDAGDINLLSALATAKFRMGLYEEALEIFHQALSIEPNNPMLLNNIGLVLGYNEKNAEARKMFEEALKKAPDLNLAARNYAGTSVRDNIIYRLHYRLFGTFLRSHGRYMFMLLFLFFGLLCLSEITRPGLPAFAKSVDILTWLSLFAALSVFIMPQIGNILVVFRKQYKHLYSLNDRIASTSMFLLYSASFACLMAGLFSGGLLARKLQFLSLSLLAVTLLLTIRFGTLREWRPLATLLVIFFYMAGGLFVLYINLLHVGFFYLFYVSSGFLVLGLILYLLRPR